VGVAADDGTLIDAARRTANMRNASERMTCSNSSGDGGGRSGGVDWPGSAGVDRYSGVAA
jgi:hypothetical protein